MVIAAVAPGGLLVAPGDFLEIGPLLIVGVVLAILMGPAVGIYVGLGLTMGELAVTFENLEPMAALKWSWSLADGHRFDLFLFFLVAGLLLIVSLVAGLLMCLLGGIVILQAGRAIVEVAFTEGFLLYTGADKNRAEWAISSPIAPNVRGRKADPRGCRPRLP